MMNQCVTNVFRCACILRVPFRQVNRSKSRARGRRSLVVEHRSDARDLSGGERGAGAQAVERSDQQRMGAGTSVPLDPSFAEESSQT
ncbi:hypothetical protein PVAP13_6KG250906 [Panicum virgatum]|uniref:Uncharacterized protein n=1 Tax=Panicum virgatum TaxID=38727 RepID=A0A8T0RFE3_PANVG|nr:hypothetical protein PVAP13_6KG250906 [Panicum virgatum]